MEFLIIFGIVYCFFSILTTGYILDENPMPNKTKENLALLLIGPTGWVVCIFRYCVKAISPICKNIYDWFYDDNEF